MASVLITQLSSNENSTYITASCGKVSVYVSFNPIYDAPMRICVLNSSNRTYRRGIGKTFADFDAAIRGYKSSEVRAIILTAADLIRATKSPATAT